MYKADFVGDDAETWDLFVEYHRTGDRAVRNELIERHLALAESLARRYEGRGEPAPDLRQVAMIGLLKAIERFDPWRGVPFASFAVPTVRGELRRHFRDTGWTVRVPRRLQELHLDLREVASELAHRLGRSPTIPEIAEAAGVEEEAVLEGMEAARLYRVLSLDAPAGGESNGALSELLGAADRELAAAEAREAVRPMLDTLAERERRIVYLRYFEERTQTEIAELVGVSQMHVSRLLESSLRLMRSSATAPPAAHLT
jgi:RNA polymerase sigma-B factor